MYTNANTFFVLVGFCPVVSSPAQTAPPSSHSSPSIVVVAIVVFVDAEIVVVVAAAAAVQPPVAYAAEMATSGPSQTLPFASITYVAAAVVVVVMKMLH